MAANPDIDDFARDLYEALERAVSIRANETELREDADRVIFPAAQQLFGIPDFGMTAERGSRGRYDKAYGGLVVEWEWSMGAARRAHGADQALSYLEAMRADLGLDEAFSAVVCDGRQWGFLVTDTAVTQLDLFGATDEIPPDDRFAWRPNSPAACRQFLTLIGSNRQTPVTATGLAAAFGSASSDARAVVGLFSELLAGRQAGDRADTFYREWRRLLEVVYGNLDDRQGELAPVLRRSFEIQAEGTLGELLFAVHTYFALVVRLVAIEVLALAAAEADSQPTTWTSLSDGQLEARLKEIDEGGFPRSVDLQNLFEGDVFTWYLPSLSGNADLLNAIRDVLTALGQFALPRLAYGLHPSADVLRNLYQALVPRALRRHLGEFLTPHWLAESCLERLASAGAPLQDGRVADLTGGTGTFLLPILRSRLTNVRRAPAPTSADVQSVLDGIVYFDINPVAVLAARVNYVVSLGDLASLGPLTLPAWRADTLLVPEVVSGQTTTDVPLLTGHEWLALRTSLPDPFPIPVALATAARMAQLRRGIEGVVEEPDDAVAEQDFVADLQASVGPNSGSPSAVSPEEWQGVRDVSLELLRRVRALAAQDRNGVWARIIENAFAPLFVDRFDVVVGNPPWLSWSNMPAEWRGATQELWRRYGLFNVPPEEGQPTRGASNGDISTLVFAAALERYVRPTGWVGLLVQKALINADPGGRAFRRFRLRPRAQDTARVHDPPDVAFRVYHVDDWSVIGPFSPDAQNTPIFAVARRDEAHSFPVPGVKWERGELGAQIRGQSWLEAQRSLRGVQGGSWSVVRSISTSQWSFQPSDAPQLIEGGRNAYDFGKGLDTRGANGIFFVDVLGSHLDGTTRLVEIRNRPGDGRRVVQQRRGSVEAELVHPLLRGEGVRPWIATPDRYIIAPYLEADLGHLLEGDEWQPYRRAHNWLRQFRALLQGRSAPPTGNWNLQGADWCRIDGPLEHMGRGSCVVIREIATSPAAAVVTDRWDAELGRTAKVLIEHKLIFCSVTSEDEAHYICGFMNSTPVQDLIRSFVNPTAVSSALRRVPVVPYEPGSASRLVVAAREAEQAAVAGGDLAEKQQEVDSAVLELLDLGDEYRPQVRPVRRRPRAVPEGENQEPLF